MLTLEDAREQLLNQIELEANCRIYPINSEAPEKLNEFYNETAALPISHPIFHWYLLNNGNIQIEYRGGGINLVKTDDQEPEHFTDKTVMIDEVDDLIDQAFDNQN